MWIQSRTTMAMTSDHESFIYGAIAMGHEKKFNTLKLETTSSNNDHSEWNISIEFFIRHSKFEEMRFQ